MGVVRKTVVASAWLLTVVGGAQAADLSLSASPSQPFDWQGFYAGVTGGYYVTGYTNLDVVGGANFVPAENFLIGLEGGVGPYFDVGGGFGGGWEVYGAGRVGLIADRSLFYGVGGIEAYSWGGSHLFAGVGAEFAPIDFASVRLQAVAHNGGDINVTSAVLFHF